MSPCFTVKVFVEAERIKNDALPSHVGGPRGGQELSVISCGKIARKCEDVFVMDDERRIFLHGTNSI